MSFQRTIPSGLCPRSHPCCHSPQRLTSRLTPCRTPHGSNDHPPDLHTYNTVISTHSGHSKTCTVSASPTLSSPVSIRTHFQAATQRVFAVVFPADQCGNMTTSKGSEMGSCTLRCWAGHTAKPSAPPGCLCHGPSHQCKLKCPWEEGQAYFH